MACAHKGVEGECFDKIELPMIMGGSADLKGSQNGKFQGMITTVGGENSNYYASQKKPNLWLRMSNETYQVWARVVGA